MTETIINANDANTFKKQLNILVVDDDAINLHLIRTILVRFGQKVDLAKDGALAVAKFIDNFYDVILMDIMMPVMDGVTATIEIRKIEVERKTEAGQRVKIIAITANSCEDDRVEFLAAGMDHYMNKPFQIDELQRLLNL